MASHHTRSYGTFCAEPVNTAVQEYACKHITPNFMNSYWGTEHGSMPITRHLGREVKPDTQACGDPAIVLP